MCVDYCALSKLVLKQTFKDRNPCHALMTYLMAIKVHAYSAA